MDKKYKNKFTKRIKELRKNQGLTQKELAIKTEMSHATISNYERGFKNPNADNLIKLANFFNTSSDYLLGLTDRKENPKHLLDEIKANSFNYKLYDFMIKNDKVKQILYYLMDTNKNRRNKYIKIILELLSIDH